MLLTSRIFTIIFYDSNGRSSLVLLVKELEDRLEAGVRSPCMLGMTCNATKEIDLQQTKLRLPTVTLCFCRTQNCSNVRTIFATIYNQELK